MRPPERNPGPMHVDGGPDLLLPAPPHLRPYGSSTRSRPLGAARTPSVYFAGSGLRRLSYGNGLSVALSAVLGLGAEYPDRDGISVKKGSSANWTAHLSAARHLAVFRVDLARCFMLIPLDMDLPQGGLIGGTRGMPKVSHRQCGRGKVLRQLRYFPHVHPGCRGKALAASVHPSYATIGAENHCGEVTTMGNKADNTHHEDSQLQAQDTATEPEWAIEPTGAPEDFGIPQFSRPVQKRVWDRQEAYLAAYAECGRRNKAAATVGLTYWAIRHWDRHDVFSFRERQDVAHLIYCETQVEGLIDERLANPEGNRGSDILLMFKAKAEMPEKYREEVKIVDTRETKDLLEELRRLGRPNVIEGSVVSKEPPQESE